LHAPRAPSFDGVALQAPFGELCLVGAITLHGIEGLLDCRLQLRLAIARGNAGDNLVERLFRDVEDLPSFFQEVGRALDLLRKAGCADT
jgi:hypothetical protein